MLGSLLCLGELFLKQNKKCALTGIDIHFPETAKEHSKGTASLDRIDSSKPYNADNVQWVHKTVGMMKLAFTQTEFIEWCKLIARYNE